MSKTNIFSTPEHYEAPVCETVETAVEINFMSQSEFDQKGEIEP